MSLALAAALSFSPAATLPACSWDRPGHDPFMGNVVEAVERYTNIPPEVRDRLKQRMAARQYDEIVTIGRDSITGKHRYAPEIRDMHFGSGRVCRTVSRAGWAPNAIERGLVYCEATHCIIVPTVCRNVSRITRLPPDKPALATGPTTGPATGTLPGAPGLSGQPTAANAPLQDSRPTLLAANGMPDVGELVFDPPGAGATAADNGRAAIQGALASVASPGPGAEGGLPGGGASPGINFNPFGGGLGVGGGNGGTGGGATPLFPPLPPVTGSFTPGLDGLPGTVIDPPVILPPAPPVLPPALPPALPPVTVLPEDLAPGVPEPRTWAMWAAGLAALALLARRRGAGAWGRVRS